MKGTKIRLVKLMELKIGERILGNLPNFLSPLLICDEKEGKIPPLDNS